MVLSLKKLVGKPVVTRSGQLVGKVAGFEIDTLTGRIATMQVKSSGLVARLSEDVLIVSWDAIVEMTEKRVTIIDSVVQNPITLMSAAGMTPNPSPTLMREI